MQFVFIATLFVQVKEAHCQIPCRYDVNIIQAPPCQFTGPPVTQAFGISPNGKYVVGSYAQCDGKGNEAFCYDTETKEFFTLPRPHGLSTANARDVNDSGWTVGRGGGGFLYKLHENEWIFLQPAGSGSSVRPNAINNAGQICGRRSFKKSPNPFNGFIWSESEGFTDLGSDTEALDINESGTVVGWAIANIPNDDARGFVYQNGVITVIDPLPGGINSYASGINNANQVVLYSKLDKSGETKYKSYVYLDGSIEEIATPDGFNRAFAGDITDSQLIVGASSHSSNGNVFYASVWDRGSVAVLDDLIDSASGVRIEVARSASEQNWIIGRGLDSRNDVVGFVLKPALLVKGDTDCNEFVNVNDLRNVILEWGKCECCSTDLTGDGLVDHHDVMMVIDNWTYEK